MAAVAACCFLSILFNKQSVFCEEYIATFFMLERPTGKDLKGSAAARTPVLYRESSSGWLATAVVAATAVAKTRLLP